MGEVEEISASGGKGGVDSTMTPVKKNKGMKEERGRGGKSRGKNQEQS